MTAKPPGRSERSPPRLRMCLGTIRQRSNVDRITTARIDAQTPPSNGDRPDTMVPERQDTKHRRSQTRDHAASPARQCNGVANPGGMLPRKIGNVALFCNRRDDLLGRRNGNGRQMRRPFLRIYSTQRALRLAVSRAPPDGAVKRVAARSPSVRRSSSVKPLRRSAATPRRADGKVTHARARLGMRARFGAR